VQARHVEAKVASSGTQSQSWAAPGFELDNVRERHCARAKKVLHAVVSEYLPPARQFVKTLATAIAWR